MKEVLETMCEFYELEPLEIFTNNREARSVKYRQIFVYTAKQIDYNLKFWEISCFIEQYSGCFYNHATHLHSIRQVQNKMDIYPKFRDEMIHLKRIIKDPMPPIVVMHVDLLGMCARTF